MSKIFTSEEETLALEEVLSHLESKAISLRSASAILEHKTGKKITYEGLRKMLKKRSENSGRTEPA